jgi:competence protein ComGC
MSETSELRAEAQWVPSGHKFTRIAAIASLIRDLGVILGIPLLLVVGFNLWDIQEKAYEAQGKANEAQISLLEAQNNALKEAHEAQSKALEDEISFLKETQYDRALALIEAQKKIFEMERAQLQHRIAELETAGAPVPEELKIRVQNRNLAVSALQAYTDCLQKSHSTGNDLVGKACLDILASKTDPNAIHKP